MLLSADSYLATLTVRPSEMNGLEFLPNASKDKVTPLFLLAPWVSARELQKAVDRIERSYPGRRFYLDIDRDYLVTDPSNPAQAEWQELSDPGDSYAKWWEFWSKYPNACPCIQINKQDRSELDIQIKSVQAQGREFCLRIELPRRQRNLSLAIDLLAEIGTADYSIVIEGGWTRDPLTLAAQARAIIEGPLRVLDSRIPVVVSCTSMPKSFTDFEGLCEHAFTNRQLIEKIRAVSNRDIVVYGDWGSTKPREELPGRTPLPRVDYAIDRSWIFARNAADNWSFKDAAAAVVRSKYWAGDLGIWGEKMIIDTVADPDFGINSPQKNVAARVNIHLHRQALFGSNIRGIDLDDDWVD